MSQAEVHLAVIHQRCPRRRMLAFDLFGTGIELVHLDVVATTRKFIREGLSYLLAGDDVEKSIRTIQTRLADEYSTRGIDPQDTLDPFEIFTEQSALVKAVMLGFARRIEPLLARYQIIDAETMRLVSTGEVYSYVLRPVATADRDTLVRDLHSLYTVARGAADRAMYGEKYGGLFLQYVVLGERREREQRSPFITGYKQKVGGRMAARRDRIDPRTGKATRLGSDFQRFRVWDNRSPVVLEDWIEMLAGWNELESLFPSVLVNPPQEAEGAEAWAVVRHLNHLSVPAQPSALALERFPMYRHSCDSPTICPFQQLDCCYGDISLLDPTQSGVYRRKESLDVND